MADIIHLEESIRREVERETGLHRRPLMAISVGESLVSRGVRLAVAGARLAALREARERGKGGADA